ncbi:salicylate carboxymethyltransferase-like [Punica granatum]|uniref:Salicylate carboxymethyltransferase-like n=2 Tax=Punica granatum TaxID=22663 RepID=A0A6P8BPR2_PUNGR|nr:salicylate carboxymethyltransferase-like [Punica granatum]
MEITKVLHMNGGVGETSYTNNSSIQRKVTSMTGPIAEEAITALYSSISPSPSTLAIADLGCSTGANALFAVSELIKAVENMRHNNNEPHAYQIFLNDLPGNDFNTVFRTLPKFQKENGRCFFAGVPGSFYDRLFPNKFLHFIHSSYSLQFLSQVPEGIECNKGNISMASTSPPSVIDAYHRQFQNDFLAFLKYRAQELVPGGRMVITFVGRRGKDPWNPEWELLAAAFNEMVSEGLIEEEKVDVFNIPHYKPCPSDVEAEVLKEGSFSINRLEVSGLDWIAIDKEFGQRSNREDEEVGGYGTMRCMRAVAEPMLISHFGEGIMEDLFHRYRLLIIQQIAKEKTELINVTVSLTRRPA